MLTSFVIALREGLEAALIVAIVLSFLGRTGAHRQKRYVWYGAGAALAGCLAAGTMLFAISEDLAEEAGEVFEIAVSLLAAGMLAFMVMWMKRHGRELKSGLESRVQRAAGPSSSSSATALFLLAFTAIGREGLETVLFLLGNAAGAGAGSTLAGGAAGLAVAAAAGLALYRGVYRIDLKRFFNVTGVLLIIFAAGLIGNVMSELAEGGFLPVFITSPVWDAGSWLNQGQGLGALLHSLVGYQSQPSLLALAAYGVFLASMLWIYLRRGRTGMKVARQAN